MRLALACAFLGAIVLMLALTIPARQREQRTEQLARRAACLEWKQLPYHGATDWNRGFHDQLALLHE